MPRSLIVVPLGSLTPHQVRSAVGSNDFDVLDRSELRRRPVDVLWRLARRRYERAVLVAPDLRAPRLRLTSLLLALPRARCRVRTDTAGHSQRWAFGAHVQGNALALVRHGLACGLAALLAEPLLALLEAGIRPRTRPMATPGRLLYLRSQWWLGLEGGGSVAHTAGVIGGLEEAGVQVQVVSSDSLAGVHAPTRVVAPEVWFDGAARELEELAYNVPFLLAAWRSPADVLYQRHTTFNVAGAVLSRLRRRPLVLEFNSSEVWKGRYWGGLRRERLAQRVERINLRAADHVVVVSEPLRASLVDMGVPRHKILVNPNGVDPRVFRPDVDARHVRSRWDLEGAVVIGFSGTFGVWHGIPTLAAVLQRVLDQRPSVRWLLIGDGPLRGVIDAAAGADPRVARPGLVPHHQMPSYLAACDVLVSPHGRQADGGEFFGSPTKLFEYMAAGRAIVASRVGQISQVLEHERSALLVPPDDPDALGAALLRLVDHAELRQRLASNARADAIERHTWRQNAQRVLDVLDNARP